MCGERVSRMRVVSLAAKALSRVACARAAGARPRRRYVQFADYLPRNFSIVLGVSRMSSSSLKRAIGESNARDGCYDMMGAGLHRMLIGQVWLRLPLETLNPSVELSEASSYSLMPFLAFSRGGGQL